MSSSLPIDNLTQALKRNTLVRIFEEFEETYPEIHLKDLVVDEIGPGREILVRGRWVINFGSDSFLGLDRDPRVHPGDPPGRGPVGISQRNLAGLRQRPLQRRCGGEAGVLAGRGSDAHLPLRHPGQSGSHSRTDRPQGRHRDGRAGSQLDPGGSQAGPGRGNPGRHLRAQQPGRPGTDAPQAATLPAGFDLHRRRLQHERRHSARWPRSTRSPAATTASSTSMTPMGPACWGSTARERFWRPWAATTTRSSPGRFPRRFPAPAGSSPAPQPFQKLLKMRSNSYIFGGPVVTGLSRCDLHGRRDPGVQGVRSLCGLVSTAISTGSPEGWPSSTWSSWAERRRSSRCWSATRPIP